jgi:hypothetical protein
MPEFPPQHPGHVKIDVTPGAGSLSIDGYDIGQFVRKFSLQFNATLRRPVLLLEVLPGDVQVEGTEATAIELHPEFTDFLIGIGWRPPE